MVGEERVVADKEVLRVGEVEEALEARIEDAAKTGGEKSAEETELGDKLEASVSEASETDADGDAD